MQSNHTSMFGYLPPDIFRPLVGELSGFYAGLLEYLDAEIFGFAGEVVTRKAAIAAIGEFIARNAHDLRLGDDVEMPASERELRDPRAYIAYRRLLDTGWLLEARDRYRRTVDFDPNARVLLQALLDLKNGRLRSYGGAVLRVFTLLESAKNEPSTRSENIREAALSARSFMNHLRTISGAMRKAEELILGQTDLKSLFRQFFEDFVEAFVVQDWKRLHTRDNPFRFRTQIREIGHNMLENELILRELGAAYMREGRARDEAHGREIVVEEIQTVLRVFDAVDDHVELIEDTNHRIERRIANTVRFMDRIAETKTERLALAIGMLGAWPQAYDVEVNVTPRVLSLDLPTGGGHLYQQSRRRPDIEAQKIRRPPVDPAFKAYRDALVAFQSRLAVTPAKLADYLERMLGTRAEMRGSEFQVETLDDFIAFERLRELPFLAGGALAGRYRVETAREMIENEWIRCPDFVVRRTAEEKKHAGAG